MKKNFGFVLIVCLLELILLHIVYSSVYNYSDIKNVVDAFAFGGTLVGILVGVIAIIYAFYQGAAQQETNNAMVSELTKLATIKEEIGNSARLLGKELGELDRISEKLNLIENSVSTTHEGIKEISVKIGNDSSLSSKFGSESLVVIDNKYVIKFLDIYINKQAKFYLFFFAYLLKNRGVKTVEEHIDEFFKIAEKYEVEYRKKYYTFHVKYVVFQCLLAVFSSLGIISISEEDIDRDEEYISWDIKDEFIGEVDRIYGMLLKATDDIDHTKILEEVYALR
ncbi:hypothetical protein JAB6_05790 [Janthinobacterium sp. HH104]|uniref:hypothetical protein n=1 Tax=Janthinobacterium sp. HH104 TaxID=1537276 RepID=UPI0008932FBF|nr:hypothetical protein [Janthinobacterium sp. HH104]OEZ88539.1 hypothetical protein JAB6_05790 [Janthinobacterium sp. HH104]